VVHHHSHREVPSVFRIATCHDPILSSDFIQDGRKAVSFQFFGMPITSNREIAGTS
jgi:hypothetical protein